MKFGWKTVPQVVLLMLFSILMNKLSALLHLPLPGSILGMIVLYALLETKVVQLSWIESGAAWLLAELLLFFIPPSVGLIAYRSLLLHEGLRILLVIVLGTVIVMVCTGAVAERMANRRGGNSR
ncbi:CidA/LrgA family holin-like protein [Paenibacillus sp. MBLB4367]|uniref:CidA/LrgA family holin-like protein n=1 Tax=Paenibacillus sp. MBLB4367 TaxID=3384767 RepID=UPI00390800B9